MCVVEQNESMAYHKILVIHLYLMLLNLLILCYFICIYILNLIDLTMHKFYKILYEIKVDNSAACSLV